MKSKIKFLLAAIMLLAGTTNARAQQSIEVNDDVEPLIGNTTCTHLSVTNGAVLIVNQGLTLTLNCVNNDFELSGHSTIELAGTMTGYAGSDATWYGSSSINVYLHNGAKYTVTGLSCEGGDDYLQYFGYDAGTDGHGTVSVTNGTFTVTAGSLGYRTTTYTFTATPNSGYRFVNWTKGAGGEVLGTAASIAVTCEQNGQYQVYANFEEVPAEPQTRTLTGVPQGWTVQAGDPLTGVDSNADGSYSIAAGQQVLLVPSAEDKPRVKSVTLTEVPSAVLVESITLNKTATTILAGSTETLSVATVTPDDATDQTVTWSSDNEAVATVNATTGEVTAVALGTANITATANDGSGVTATCAVTVNKVVTINQSDWGNSWGSFSKDGVTVTASMIDPEDGNLMGGGTFSTTLGNFKKIVVTTHDYYASGTGWSGGTWAGTPASTVSFSGDFMGLGLTQTTIVCTIAPTN